jgi:two-component system sensor histidine kinase YcbA
MYKQAMRLLRTPPGLLVSIALGTALCGEIKLNLSPFGEQFRFSLSPVMFFFSLLWFRQIHPLVIGLAVGISMPLFRIGLSMIGQGGSFVSYVPIHAPAAVYYLAFAALFGMLALREWTERTWLVALTGALCDFFSNTIELTLRLCLGEFERFAWQSFVVMSVIALLRATFVVALYDMIGLRYWRALSVQQKRQIERLLLINSSLYKEGFYLRKLMTEIEEITRNSFWLYRELRAREKDGGSDLNVARQVLQIAEEIHELKKDSQRVLAGLWKVINQEKFDRMITLRELCELVVHANENYAQMLGKTILFSSEASDQLRTNRIYALLAILNNLVANAVEAIEREGNIMIKVELKQEDVEFHVFDDGPGVPEVDAAYIFQPGYTTKYDRHGNPSTGIGLLHCVDIARSLGGEVYLANGRTPTTFVARIPHTSLQQTADEQTEGEA